MSGRWQALSREPLTLPLSRRGVSQACFTKGRKVREARAQVPSPKRVSFYDNVEVREYSRQLVRVCHGFRMERRLGDITPIFCNDLDIARAHRNFIFRKWSACYTFQCTHASYVGDAGNTPLVDAGTPLGATVVFTPGSAGYLLWECCILASL